MNNLKKRINARGQGGFTLIELLVVIAILGILAAVVVFAVGNSTDDAKTSACKTEASEMETAGEAAKAAQLNNPAATISDFLSGGAAALNGKYFTATPGAGSAVTFAPAGDNAGNAICANPADIA